VLVPVPGVVIAGVIEAKIGTEIDHHRGEVAHLCQLGHAHAVRQRHEKDVRGLKIGAGDELEVGHFAQVRMRGLDELARLAFTGDLRQFDIRVLQQQTHEFAPRVSRSANDGCREFGHDFPLVPSNARVQGPPAKPVQ
jgi:hypothetical protein